MADRSGCLYRVVTFRGDAAVEVTDLTLELIDVADDVMNPSVEVFGFEVYILALPPFYYMPLDMIESRMHRFHILGDTPQAHGNFLLLPLSLHVLEPYEGEYESRKQHRLRK